MTYGFGTVLQTTISKAVEKVTTALHEEGFGVLSDIDVQDTLKNKLGINRAGYRILGACNPDLANQAIQAEPDIGLLLPCNVLLREEENEMIQVLFIDPEVMLAITGRDDIQPLAQEVKKKLQQVCDRLTHG